MINFSFGPNIFLGIIVGFGVLILYFLRNVKPKVARDEDIFFATIGLLYSCILMVHGWRLDPILLFSNCFGFYNIGKLRVRKNIIVLTIDHTILRIELLGSTLAYFVNGFSSTGIGYRCCQTQC